MSRYDVGVVGAGILGLAHAYEYARRGLKVAVFERHPRARGASVRNFGMIWPIGQPAGPLAELARRSREIWLQVLRESGLWFAEAGSLHLAYHDDEAQVLRELATGGTVPAAGWLAPAEVISRSPAVVRAGLHGGLWSPWELTVDPRNVIAGLPDYLHHTFGVDFHWDTPALRWERPWLSLSTEKVHLDRLIVCAGTDFRTLFPNAFPAGSLVECKLQMMRSQPYGNAFRLGPMLAAGLTLLHYGCFATCPTLPALTARLERELPEYRTHGIHVMAAQNEAGAVTIGDSHVYGSAATEPFDDPEIDRLILEYLSGFVRLPDLRIAERWNGAYLKHRDAAYVAVSPEPEVLVVTGVGGAGMTLSFGLAERLVADWLGE